MVLSSIQMLDEVMLRQFSSTFDHLPKMLQCYSPLVGNFILVIKYRYRQDSILPVHWTGFHDFYLGPVVILFVPDSFIFMPYFDINNQIDIKLHSFLISFVDVKLAHKPYQLMKIYDWNTCEFSLFLYTYLHTIM